jgi:hypothetical protein
LVISIGSPLNEGRILVALESFRMLTQGRDSKSSGQALFHVFRSAVADSKDLLQLRRIASWGSRSERSTSASCVPVLLDSQT